MLVLKKPVCDWRGYPSRHFFTEDVNMAPFQNTIAIDMEIGTSRR